MACFFIAKTDIAVVGCDDIPLTREMVDQWAPYNDELRKTLSFVLDLPFLVIILAGTVLLMLPYASESGDWTDPLTALFIATSAVSTDGTTVELTFLQDASVKNVIRTGAGYLMPPVFEVEVESAE